MIKAGQFWRLHDKPGVGGYVRVVEYDDEYELVKWKWPWSKEIDREVTTEHFIEHHFLTTEKEFKKAFILYKLKYD